MLRYHLVVASDNWFSSVAAASNGFVVGVGLEVEFVLGLEFGERVS